VEAVTFPMAATSSNPKAASSAPAERNDYRSACLRPDELEPHGRPSPLRPAHTVAAGERVMLKG